MLRTIIRKTFDVREGEFKISFWMQAYVFLIIAVLLIIKPTVNAIFLSELGAEQLPWAYLLVAVTAILSSAFYTKALARFSLQNIIQATLLSSVLAFALLGILMKFQLVSGWMLYFYYVWVAIYALLSASQFWVMANLVFDLREAKRLFGFIGSGAILGGIVGGYLTSLLSPAIGTEYTLILAALLADPLFSTIKPDLGAAGGETEHLQTEKTGACTGRTHVQADRAVQAPYLYRQHRGRKRAGRQTGRLPVQRICRRRHPRSG